MRNCSTCVWANYFPAQPATATNPAEPAVYQCQNSDFEGYGQHFLEVILPNDLECHVSKPEMSDMEYKNWMEMVVNDV